MAAGEALVPGRPWRYRRRDAPLRHVTFRVRDRLSPPYLYNRSWWIVFTGRPCRRSWCGAPRTTWCRSRTAGPYAKTLGGGASLELIDGAGHAAHLEKPAEVLAALQLVLNG